ncbi:MAG: 2Fe-2S iron-sulfur cluster-binding protein [Ginsengibacter sp.]
MVIQKRDISFTIIGEDEEHVIETYAGEYRNLMALITDKIYIEDFGECKGMGRCGTCVIEIIKTENELLSLERNEEATIKKTGITNPNYRLACQVLINEQLKNTTFRICYNL